MYPIKTKSGLNISPLLNYGEIQDLFTSKGFTIEEIEEAIGPVPGEDVAIVDVDLLEELKEILLETEKGKEHDSLERQISILEFLFQELDEEYIIIYTGD